MKTQTICAIFALACLFFGLTAHGQSLNEAQNLRFEFSQSSLQLDVGETTKLTVRVLDNMGKNIAMPFLLYGDGADARRAISVEPRTATGSTEATIKALRPGQYKLTARTVTINRFDRTKAQIKVDIAYPSLAKMVFIKARKQLYEGTTIRYSVEIFDDAGLKRQGAWPRFRSNNPEIASVDDYGNVTAHKVGTFQLSAERENVSAKIDLKVIANPVDYIKLSGDEKAARTGDVLQFQASAFDAIGGRVADAPIHYSVSGRPEFKLGPAASAEIDKSGRFVAETPGFYTITANSGNHIAKETVHIQARNYMKKLELVGHGKVLDVFTSDLWVWEGADQRDYAVTGTWGANGDTYFWDVTDPANIHSIDTLRVDARTVNDVKVSADGKIAVISREGASNRRNGIVILDIENPADVKILSTFDEELTGGVHNVFIYEDHVYAVNNSIRYDVINIADPTNPYRVSRFELNTPGHGVHDVWIENGIAFSSNWQDGLQLVDIGGVTAGRPFREFGETASPEIATPFLGGGSPSNPIQFASYDYPSGWNHAALPYFDEQTRKFYVLAGDEAFPYGLGSRTLEPSIAAGWIHFIDFTDPKNPKDVASYKVPEAGSHNYWIEDDLLYAAFYNGGLRVVDLSGDLMGDLYRQGREVASFIPRHRDSLIPNAPMVWGPMPHKGIIYFSDMNTGLWAVRLVEKSEDEEGTN